MQSVLEDHPGSTFHRRLVGLSAVLAVCASCATPRRAPLDDSHIAASVLGRASSVAELEVALALADLGPLAVPRPVSPATLDPASPDFWFTCAFLYEPGVRKARRALEAKRALALGAGAVPSINAGADHVGPGGSRETDVMATLDLLALLGLGPSAAAKELARAEVREALADLEAAVWAARFRVSRALDRLEAAREREAEAATIAKEANEDSARFKTLEDGGRGSPAEFAWARASLARVEEVRARSRIEAARSREELAMATGLPPGHAAIARGLEFKITNRLEPTITGGGLDFATTDPVLLLAHVPRLRAKKLKYAIAEAQVRSAAAAAWPGIGLGPKLRFIPDHFLTGGVVDLTLPLPGATRPLICAALIERTAAREALEDELVGVLARNQSLNWQAADLPGVIKEQARSRRDAADHMWRAARARFRSDDSALTGWVLGLEMRLDASVAAISTAESIALLESDIGEASGPRHPESRPE